MFLAQLKIENYRGIRSASLNFDNETLLIGENDCGKSAILEALALVLGSDTEAEPPLFKLFHFFNSAENNIVRPAGPIRIMLHFIERTAGEWSELDLSSLGITMTGSGLKHELTFELWSFPTDDGTDARSHWRMDIIGSGIKIPEDEPAVLEWIRTMSPLIWLRGGVLSGRIDMERLTGGGTGAGQPGNPEMMDMIGKIDTHYRNLLSGTTLNVHAELQSGYESAIELLNRTTGVFNPKRGSLQRVVEEVLGKRAVDRQAESHDIVRLHGSAAEKIGVLLFTVALLNTGTRLLHKGAEPVIIIEDPEAHLHPMTLVSVMGLIEDIKWQKILTTQSGLILASVPLYAIRRITRDHGIITEWRVHQGTISDEDLRRLNYHLRMRHGEATFGRCWLLIEGESETWLLPNMAKLCGYELQLEGVDCVEFAQCGLKPLIRMAQQLGIEWHLLADGDKAGDYYVETAREFIEKGQEESLRISQFREPDIENFFWGQGYAGVYQHYAQISDRAARDMPSRQVIRRAIENRSKPFLAIAVVESVSRENSPGVPEFLKQMIASCVDLAHRQIGSSGTD
jgi:putative ATP-dependent endonuclease of OLD family